MRPIVSVVNSYEGPSWCRDRGRALTLLSESEAASPEAADASS